MFDKRIIFILLISFALSAFVSVSLNDHSKDLYKQVFVYKVWSEKKYDLLIAGDSRIYRGISTKPFEDELGIKALNLGFSSGQFEDYMFDLIDEKLANNSGNKAIILGITPYSLTSSSYPNGHIRRIKNYKDEEVLEYLYLLDFKKYFGSVGDVNIHQKLFSDHQENYISEPKKNEGWIASDYRIRKPYSAIKSYHKTFSEKEISKQNIENLMLQIQEWIQQGITVYGFIPPSSPNIETIERMNSGFSDREIAKQFINNGGKWILLDNFYESYDGSHLTKESAVSLSEDLATKIKNGQFLSKFDDSRNYRFPYLPPNAFHIEERMSDSLVFHVESNQKWFRLTDLETNYFLENEISKVYFTLDVLNREFKAQQNFVVNIKRGGENLVYQKLNLSWILKKGEWTPVFYHFDVPHDLQEGDEIKAFIYNEDNELEIKNIKLYYYQ